MPFSIMTLDENRLTLRKANSISWMSYIYKQSDRSALPLGHSCGHDPTKRPVSLKLSPLRPHERGPAGLVLQPQPPARAVFLLAETVRNIRRRARRRSCTAHRTNDDVGAGDLSPSFCFAKDGPIWFQLEDAT